MLKKNLWTTILVAIIYSALLLPLQSLMSLLPGTEVRPAAFFPIVAGLFFGLPGAIGIFIGNLVCDLITFPYSFSAILLGSVANFFYAYFPHVVWYSYFTKINRSELFIYDIRTLIKFILIVVVDVLLVSILIGLIISSNYGISVNESFILLLLNNLSFGFILGIPLVALLPYMKIKSMQSPRTPRKTFPMVSSWMMVLGFIMSCAYMAYRMVGSEVGHESYYPVIALLLLFFGAMSGRPICAPEPMNDDEMMKASVKVKIFLYCLSCAMVISLLVGAIIFFVYRQFAPDRLNLWRMTYGTMAVALNVILLSFILLLYKIDANITAPLYAIARGANRDMNGKSELEILGDALDFIVTQADGQTLNTEHKLFIGLNDKNTLTQIIATKDARKVVDEICVQYADGYLANESEGGWKNEDDKVTHETTLVYAIFGATDDQVRKIARDALTTLNQEAILIEKNGRQREFYYGEPGNAS